MLNRPLGPIEHVVKHLPGCLATIAPERANELESLAKTVRLELTDETGFAFGASRDGTTVFVPVRGLEYLWALGLTAWGFAELRNVSGTIPLDTHAATRGIESLIPWALRNQQVQTYEPWPAQAVAPGPLHEATVGGPVVSRERVASELALCATAWVLHHELAHVRSGDVPDNPNSIQQELDADGSASSFILDRSPPGIPLLKRSLGIAIATVSLAGLEMATGAPMALSRTHPNPANRIHRALSHPSLGDDHPAHSIAALMLKLHFDAYGVMTPQGEYDTGRDCLDDYCTLLYRHLS